MVKLNKFIRQTTFLWQILNVLAEKNNKSNNKLVTKFKINLIPNFEAKIFNIKNVNLSEKSIIINTNKN